MNEIKWVLSHIGNIVSGIIAVVFGYLAPVSGVISVMVGAIILDLIVGVIAARKRGEGITGTGLWKTVKKLFYAVIIVLMLFTVDVEMQVIELHKFVAWMITGFEMWSVAGNAAYITDHRIFNLIQQYMQDKIKDTTGIDINDPEAKHGNGKKPKSKFQEQG